MTFFFPLSSGGCEPKIGCQHGWALVRASSLVQTAALLLSPPMAWGREWADSKVSLLKGHESTSDQGPFPTTSSIPNCLQRPYLQKLTWILVHTTADNLTCKWQVHLPIHPLSHARLQDITIPSEWVKSLRLRELVSLRDNTVSKELWFVQVH
jgi:hypothetical protein